MIPRTSLMTLAWLAVALGAVVPAWAAGPVLRVYSNPPPLEYSHHNDDFTVRVRQPGGAWRDLYEYDVQVDLDKPQDASMVRFDFEGRVDVAIEKNNGDFRRVQVRPASADVKPRVGKDGLVHLTLDRPANLSVEFDDDRLHNLHILAGRPDAPPEPGPNVVIYGPGLHTPPAGSTYFPVHSDETVYVAGGAVLQGQFRLDGVENVRIYGRGILDRQQEQFVVHDSRNVTVEGLTFINSRYGTIACSQSKDVRFLDLKAFSAGQWSDGINVFACDGVEVDHAFVRTSDDSVAVYATRKDATGDTRNVRVANSTFWPDVAHAMFVGLHGDSRTPNIIENVAFSNIDVLDLDEDDPEYQGVMAISAGDTNLVRHISFSNVRVEHIQEGKLFNLRVVFNEKYNTSPGKGVEDVVLRNISYSGAGAPSASLIAGYDAQRRVRDVVLENVTIAGRKLKGPEKDILEVGPYVEGLSVR